ncbi:hypothetical protein NKH77_55330 [Streptomyces sp. M19]
MAVPHDVRARAARTPPPPTTPQGVDRMTRGQLGVVSEPTRTAWRRR